MWSKDAGTPYRYITRRMVEFQMESLKCALQLFPGNLHRTVIFVLIARLSGADWAVGNQISRPNQHTAFSINSLAESLSRPFETVRRHVLGMIDAGICSRTEDGIILSPMAAREGDIIGYFQGQASLFQQLVCNLAENDIALPLAESRSDDQLKLRLKAALDICLVALENNEHGNWYELILHGALIHENGLNVMDSRDLACEYGDKIIPDELRLPVKIRAISTAYGMPYATVRRHVDTMLSVGRLYKRRSGYILNTEWTAGDARIDMSDQTVQYLLRQFRTLAASGVELRDRPQA
jgi:hypothetical protein